MELSTVTSLADVSSDEWNALTKATILCTA